MKSPLKRHPRKITDKVKENSKMERNEIMKYVDHTLLLQGATWDDIKGICDDAL